MCGRVAQIGILLRVIKKFIGAEITYVEQGHFRTGFCRKKRILRIVPILPKIR